MDAAASSPTTHNFNRSIPTDAEIDILLRLPIKSLIKLKCVSKVWYDLMQSPSFITLYNANIDKDMKKASLYLEAYGANYVTKISTIEFYLSDALLIVAIPKILEGYFTMVGCSNGLVCLSIEKHRNYDEYVVLNPATRDFRHINFGGCRSSYEYIRSGFICDPDTNTFKLAKIQLDICYKIEVDLYTSNTYSWTKKTLDFPCQLRKESEVYWMTRGKRSMYWTIQFREEYMYLLCFDMVDELFTRIELPTSL